MGVKALTAVWEHSSAGGSELLVLLALADRADDAGVCWPGIVDLQRKTRQSERAVRDNVRRLENRGELSTRRRRRETSIYQILLPGLVDERTLEVSSPADSAPSLTGSFAYENVRVSAPEPSQLSEENPTDISTPEVVDISVRSADENAPKRALSFQENLATRLLEDEVLPIFASRPGYNARIEFGRVWRKGWETCLEADQNPIQFGVNLAARYLELLGEEPNWKLLGRLVGKYQTYALVGLDEALMHGVEGDREILAYATAVCKSHEERRAAEQMTN